MSKKEVPEYSKEIIEVLTKSIPQFSYFSANQKRNFFSATTEQTYLTGKVLIQEGTNNNEAFLIISGECKLYSENDPSHIRITDDGRIARTKQPSLSQQFARKQPKKTINQFQFSIKSAGQWVGEDSLVLQSAQGFPFSVAAIKPVKVLQINKSSMVKVLPYIYQKTLVGEAQARQKWLQARMKKIHYTMESANKLNSEFSKKDRAEFEYRQREYNDAVQTKMQEQQEKQSQQMHQGGAHYDIENEDSPEQTRMLEHQQKVSAINSALISDDPNTGSMKKEWTQVQTNPINLPQINQSPDRDTKSLLEKKLDTSSPYNSHIKKYQKTNNSIDTNNEELDRSADSKMFDAIKAKETKLGLNRTQVEGEHSLMPLETPLFKHSMQHAKHHNRGSIKSLDRQNNNPSPLKMMVPIMAIKGQKKMNSLIDKRLSYSQQKSNYNRTQSQAFLTSVNPTKLVPQLAQEEQPQAQVYINLAEQHSGVKGQRYQSIEKYMDNKNMMGSIDSVIDKQRLQVHMRRQAIQKYNSYTVGGQRRTMAAQDNQKQFPLISKQDSNKLIACYGMKYSGNDYNSTTQSFIPMKKNMRKVKQGNLKQIRFSATGDQLQEKLILHENLLREGTPDPTNLKRNNRLLREVSVEQQLIKGSKNLDTDENDKPFFVVQFQENKQENGRNLIHSDTVERLTSERN